MHIDGQTLKQARELAEYTQTELADKLDVSIRTIVNWESSGVPRKSLAKVMRVLGSAVDSVQTSGEWKHFLEGPDGANYLAESLKRAEARAASPVQAVALGRPMERLQRAQIITENLDDLDLLYELIRRSSGLPAGVFGRLSGADADPDYSNMSEQDAKDYGLAAKEADPNIGHDELPHEP